ncbi:glycosyltransferase family 2 protein [Liquorilactobacillus sicerae]|uniref:glycosyltransferase family 2 protein n=1 Tax=Liquorilactobacillus sicerae TaxID=1416943 RepID=UPI00247FDB9E|nr:glycosyltransferase family 2 protein [Liquorilactobacillus sicerae]
MQIKPLISVIIPIYNVSQYLGHCLESVLAQTYQNLEVILVDDGSTDESGKIADEYAQKDPRFKVIHQTNGGLSNARNKGISVAKGEYLTFIDSDDYVTRDYVEYLFNLLAKNNFKSKLAICSIKNVFEETGVQKSDENGQEVVLTGKKCIEKMCYQDLVDTCAYAKLGAKELYDKVKFPEGYIFEDIATTYQLFDLCETVACGFNAKYYYIVRQGSIVRSSFNRKKLELLPMTDKMAHFVKEHYPDLAAAALRRQVYARFSTLNQILADPQANIPQEQKKILLFLKKHRQEVMQDPKAPRRDKIAYQMLQLGLPFYRFSWHIYVKLKVR